MTAGDYLSPDELASLVGCKPNQRAEMCKWLDGNHWRYVVDKNGLPKVARLYHNRQLGIDESKAPARLQSAPDLAAFSQGSHRR